jgi:hypothetical protein
MREGDDLYFAPGLRFREVKLRERILAEQLRRRIEGFYLEPARLCIENGHAFAAGVLIVSTIDFLAGLDHGAEPLEGRKVGKDFRGFVRSQLTSFGSGDLDQRFYDEFRNGLIHEGRIKNAGEFSFNRDQTVRLAGGRLSVNPALLLGEVQAALEEKLRRIVEDNSERRFVAGRLQSQFSKEFSLVERAQTAV